MDIKKVAVIGPESTGKSELSEFLASEFKTVWVEEYAREYLNKLTRPYGPEDLLNIAKGQISLEERLVSEANQVLICDTDLYVIKVWSNFKYGFCDPQIIEWIETRKYDLYLLTYIDVPWLADPLREHPEQREVLYDIYLNEMKNQRVPFTEIRGSREQRKSLAAEGVKKILTGGSKHSQ